ncbi:MAG: autotransporter domain-containing protein [Magnetococcales bacterium]|nr:autotransporter domain-containing protein [Magnetococcales bacterium]
MKKSSILGLSALAGMAKGLVKPQVLLPAAMIVGGMAGFVMDEAQAANETYSAGGDTNTSVSYTAAAMSDTAGDIDIISIGGTGTDATAFSVGTNRSQLVIDAGSAYTLSGVISGSAAFVKSGTAVLTLSGTNTWTSNVTVAAGTLALLGTNAIGNTSSVSVAASATLTVADSETIGSLTVASIGTVALGTATLIAGGNNASTTVAGYITAGAGTFVKTGTGTLTLSGSMLFSSTAGSVTVGSGALTTGSAGAFGNTSNINMTVVSGATLTLGGIDTLGSLKGGGSVNNGGYTLTVSGNATQQDATFTGVISGSGGLSKSGASTLTLGGSNTYTGATTINEGRIKTSTSNVIGNSSAVTVTTNGVLELGGTETIGSLAGGGTVTVAGLGLTVGGDNSTTTYTGSMSGSGGLTKTGTGVMTLGGTADLTAGYTISQGGVTTTTLNIINDSAAVSISSGASLTLGGGDTIGSLAGAGNIVNGGFSLTTGGDGTSTTYSGVLSGTGGLTKSGTGTMTLSGANTYTGATSVVGGVLATGTSNVIADTSAVTVSGATLSLGGTETVGSLAGSGGVSSAYILTVGGDNSSTSYSGVMTGSGGLTKTGSGTMTLSGTNTFTGALNVAGGNVTTSAAAVIADTVDVSVGSGATLVMNQTETIGSLGGTGTVTLGTGSLTLSGTSDAAFGGTLTGTGLITKSGSSTWTIATAQTGFTGTLTVTNGRILLGPGALQNISSFANYSTLSTSGFIVTGLSGSSSVATLNLGTTTFVSTSNETTTYAGSLQGSSGLTLSGTGTLKLTGTNTYSGATSVANGTLIIGESGYLSGSTVNVSNGATLVVGDSSSTNAVIYAPVTINAGGLMKGKGTIRGNANVAGRHSPGNSPGTFTVAAGNYTNSGTLTYDVAEVPTNLNAYDINNTTLTNVATGNSVSVNGVGNGAAGTTSTTSNTVQRSDLIVVTSGSATITGATLDIRPYNWDGGQVTSASTTAAYVIGNSPNHAAYRYLVISADNGINGEFASVSMNATDATYTNLKPRVIYGTKEVQLVLSKGLNTGVFSRGSNASEVGRAIEASTQRVELNSNIDKIYNLTTSQADEALSKAAGAVHASAFNSVVTVQHNVDRIVGNHMFHASNNTLSNQVQTAAYNQGKGISSGSPQKQNMNFWASALGQLSNINGDNNAAGYDQNSAGFLLGGDIEVSKDVTVGLMAGYSRTEVNGDDKGDVDIDTFHIAGYGRVDFNDMFVRGNLGYAHNSYDSTRTISVGAINTTATGSFNGYNLFIGADLGADIKMADKVLVEPWVGIRYDHVHRDGFQEGGAGNLNLDVLSKTQHNPRTTLGVRALQTINSGDMAYEPELRIRWDHEFQDAPLETKARINGAEFTTKGVDLGHDSGTVGLGITAISKSGFDVSANYDFTFRDNANYHNLGLTLNKKF